MDVDTESYIMLLLADGNLPTGAFVASSGFESYVKHGFFGLSPSESLSATARTNQAIVDFVEENLCSYAHSALSFVSDAHIAVTAYRTRMAELESPHQELKDQLLQRLASLDELYHAMTLNDVTRRASKAQGVALLTLYSKGFSRPLLAANTCASDQENAMTQLVDALKLKIRREDIPGHLPICWGVLTGALGMTLEKSQRLHLFLQARSLLSASIRLNTIGPYAAQQLLLHVVKDLVEKQVEACKSLRTPVQEKSNTCETSDGPAITWPLGEILAARHDLQHSRIFNS